MPDEIRDVLEELTLLKAGYTPEYLGTLTIPAYLTRLATVATLNELEAEEAKRASRGR